MNRERVNIFHIDVTFEMRTVLYNIHLFNDKVYKHGHHIYMKQKEGEREQDSRETEREGACVCVCVWVAARGGSVSCKNDR
jgi:hypothetical protein